MNAYRKKKGWLDTVKSLKEKPGRRIYYKKRGDKHDKAEGTSPTSKEEWGDAALLIGGELPRGGAIQLG